MFIIECLPFLRGLNKESLTYFGAERLEPGSLIKINVRGKCVTALVLESRDATTEKSEIKSADFQLKKITAITSKPFLTKEFLEAVRAAATYFAATTGGVLTHLIPAFILENPDTLSRLLSSNQRKKSNKLHESESAVGSKTKNEIAILQTDDDERLAHYRSLVREEFAKKKSVFLCLSKNEDIRQMKEKLERGIESFVCGFHNEMGKKELKEEWKKAVSSSHPVLIIATGQWLFMPRDDISTIIVDKENESGWKTLVRPFLDFRTFIEILANKKNIRAVIGDSFLRVETLHRYKEGEISEFETVKWRSPTEIKIKIIDLKESAKKEFRVLSPEFSSFIKEINGKNLNMFIFASRKGIASLIVCRDCGEQVGCGNCAAPMVLYKTKTGSVFKCHQCGETRSAAEVCHKCGSWKLAAFGSGIDRISEEIRKDIPGVSLFEIHKDIAPSAAKAQNIIKNFYENRGSILLGTEMAFSYLHKKVTATAIASFDSLFSIPDFRIREKIFRIILQTRNIARENFLIQTRNPNDATVKLAVSGNLVEFYKQEIADRQILGYPPFGLFLKITTRGTKNFVSKETENLKNIFQDYNPIIFNSIHEKKGEPSAINAIIKLPKQIWVDQKLLAVLRLLPPHFEIKVDPDNLL